MSQKSANILRMIILVAAAINVGLGAAIIVGALYPLSEDGIFAGTLMIAGAVSTSAAILIATHPGRGVHRG